MIKKWDSPLILKYLLLEPTFQNKDILALGIKWSSHDIMVIASYWKIKYDCNLKDYRKPFR